MDLKEKEVLKLREEVDMLRLERDKANNELKNTNMRSSSALGGSRLAFGTDEKKRIRDLEQLLESKHIDLSIERKKLMNEF